MKRFLNKEISFGYDLASEYRKKYPLSELDINIRCAAVDVVVVDQILSVFLCSRRE